MSATPTTIATTQPASTTQVIVADKRSRTRLWSSTPEQRGSNDHIDRGPPHTAASGMLQPVTEPEIAHPGASTRWTRVSGLDARVGSHGGWLLLAVSAMGAVVATVANPGDARSAATQDWSPFVLVAGLLLIGLVADTDRLFSAAGQRLASLAGSGGVLFANSVVLVAVVTATLNLDTSVAFLTPVLVYTARSRGEGEAPLLYGCLLLSNAGSLLLPGSNLTNLIVLGHLHLAGGRYAARMALPWVAAVAVTALVVAAAERRSLQTTVGRSATADMPAVGLGAAAVTAAVVLVLSLRSPALPVAAVGIVAVTVRLIRRREHFDRVLDVLGLPVLVGLFGMAVALGTLGRAWSGPTDLLAHLDGWATAAVAAGTSVLVNNLPAASLLASRTPRHPFALLVGLNLGPNLFVTGSLSWILWLRAARTAGARPSIARASRLGAMSVPLSMAAALGALMLTRLQ
jgi:arsenical pump membrane protein